MGFPKPLPGALQRRTNRETLEDRINAAYRIVEVEQGMRDFVTGQKLVRQTFDPWKRLTHHHLENRSQAKSRRADPANIILLSLAIHKFVTSGALLLLTAGGVKALTVAELALVEWDRTRVKFGEEPVRVRPELLLPRRRARR
ncbi:MAG: hypothetical protein ABL982_00150 [Vicinamibacterales bacterium]